jgi:signal transduction histidine kinase
MGTKGKGLWSYQDDIFRQYEAPDRHFPSNFINTVYEDITGNLWIGFSNGAIVYNHDSFQVVPVNNSAVVAFYSIGNDSLLIASGKRGNLMLATAGNISPFETGTTLDHVAAQCFARHGRDLWIGSSDSGLIRYNLDSHQVLVINKNNGLRSNNVTSIVSDKEGVILVGTNSGFHRIVVSSQTAVKVNYYGKSEGIVSIEANLNAALGMPDGNVWFGTTKGACRYEPRAALASAVPVSMILQSVKLVGENLPEKSYDSLSNWYNIPSDLNIPCTRNSLSFSFNAITLSGTQQQYRYRLEGLDEKWSEWSDANTVSYPALPSGNYTFHAQCKNDAGGKDLEVSYPFEILTPVQDTYWFKGAILAACALLGFLIQYLINWSRRKHQLALIKIKNDEQDQIRLRAEEDFQEEIGNKLTRIRVLAKMLKEKVAPTPETSKLITQIEENTAQLSGGAEDVLWTMKPSNENLFEVLTHISEFGTNCLGKAGIAFTFDGIEEKWRSHHLPMDICRNVISIFKDALDNALKHSKAKNVSIEARIRNRTVVTLVLRDDGEGFDVQVARKGKGVNNMYVRAERMNARLYIDSRAGKGTIVTLTFQMPSKRR